MARDEDEFLSILENKNNQLMVLRPSNDSDGWISGYCLYYYVQHKKILYISSLGVAPSQQGHNYGFELLKSAIDSVPNDHACMIQLDCMPNLVSYYSKMGFAEYGKKASHGGVLTRDLPQGVSMQVSQTTFNDMVHARTAKKTSSIEEGSAVLSQFGGASK